MGSAAIEGRRPEDAGADTHYFARLAAGAFELPQCAECGRFHFYPRLVCPHCGSDSLCWQVPSGNGVVYSTTVVRRSDGDYNLALIDLAEGPRLMSRVEGIAPDQVVIGLPVRARVQLGSEPLLVFEPEATS